MTQTTVSNVTGTQAVKNGQELRATRKSQPGELCPLCLGGRDNGPLIDRDVLKKKKKRIRKAFVNVWKIRKAFLYRLLALRKIYVGGLKEDFEVTQ